MTQNDFIKAINALGTVKSATGKTYSHLKADNNKVTGYREEANATFKINTSELFTAYCQAPNATTGELKKYISGRVQSPSKAIINAIANGPYPKDDDDEFSTKDNSNPVSIKGNRSFNNKGRGGSDEYYVIGLCNKVLGKTALQQYRFDFLVGDSGKKLPVDAYYPELNLVIEYREQQHTESVKFFDKKMTVSGVYRDEQRRMYDQRRREVLPKHGIDFVEISYSDFGTSKQLKRDEVHDLEIVKKLLSKYL